MEFNHITNNEEPEQYDVEIYSRRAIWGFSIFFSTVFGGVLLMLNLRAAGYKKEGNIALGFSILYTILGSIILGLLSAPNSSAIVLNICGAGILTSYFFTKYFPEEDYYPKSIVKPLIISILICIPIAIFVYYNIPRV